MYSERPLPPPPLPSSPPTRFTLPPIGSPPMFKRTLPPLSFPNHTPPPPPAPPPPSQQHQPTTAPMNPIHHHNNSSSATIATTTSTTTGNSHASSALPFRHSNNPTTPIRELDAFSLPRPPTMSAASTYASHHHPPPPPPAASTASAASAAASSPLFRSVNGNASSPTPAQVPVPSAATRSIQPQQPERHPCKPASSSSLFTVPNRKSGNTSVSTPLPTLVADDRHMPKKEMYYRYDLDEPSPLIWQAEDADRKEEQYALVNDGLRSIESEFDEHCDAIYQEKLKKLQDELSEIQHGVDHIVFKDALSDLEREREADIYKASLEHQYKMQQAQAWYDDALQAADEERAAAKAVLEKAVLAKIEEKRKLVRENKDTDLTLSADAILMSARGRRQVRTTRAAAELDGLLSQKPNKPKRRVQPSSQMATPMHALYAKNEAELEADLMEIRQAVSRSSSSAVGTRRKHADMTMQPSKRQRSAPVS